ncbi:hypothetical protein D3Z47_02585 [Lachnospiraceae bacterium]|nr:hypothetical protein [Lachnospiraceae bacterium]
MDKNFERFVRSSWSIGLIIGALASRFIIKEQFMGVWIIGIIFAIGCSMLSMIIYMYIHQHNINVKIIRDSIILDFISLLLIAVLFYNS